MIEKLFEEYVAFAQKINLPLEGIAVADENKVLLEHHFAPDLPRNIYSHTKSYMTTAVGIAIDEGKLSLDDKLADFFPESVPENADPKVFDIKLRHLLTMSSGFGKPLLMGADRRSGVGTPDYMKYMLSQPVIIPSGTHFDYSTADSYLAGRMVEKAVGMRLSAYLYEKVFSKLDQGFPLWENCPMGHPIGGGGMFMTLSDMLKIGQVYLADGMYHGQRIVSSNWVKQASKKQMETPVDDIWLRGYGYQFWMLPYKNSYRADGAYGQITAVLPESGLVVAVQCPEIGDFQKVKEALHEIILTQL